MGRHHIIFVFLEIFLTQFSNHMVRCVITDVRLVGGRTPERGTIEISQGNGTWETTCGQNLDINDVIVICRQLGFTGASRPIRDTPYAQNSNPTKGLQCNGDETDMSECTLIKMGCPKAGAASCHGDGYLGCFGDDVPGRVFSGDKLVTDPKMSISYCIQFCNESTTANYTYAGVENGDECYCGEASNDYRRHGVGTDSDCQSPCSGDPTDSCGGLAHIAVFTISMVTPTTVSSTTRPTSIALTPSTSISELNPPDQVTTNNGNTLAIPSSSTASMAPKPTCAPPGNGLYGGIGGGVSAFIILVTIIVIIFIMGRRSRKKRKDPAASSQRMCLATANTPTGVNGLGISNAALEETSAAGGSQIGLHASNNVAASVPTTSGGDKSGLLVNLNHRKSMNIYGGIDDEVQSDGMMPYASFHTADTVQNNNGRLSVVYAMPDKNGNERRNDTSEDFDCLYAMPDKPRGQPDGNDDGIEHGLYARADESSSGDQYEPDMVENELYTI